MLKIRQSLVLQTKRELMNSKIVIVFLLIISLFLLGYFLYGQKATKNIPLTINNTSGSLNYPVNPDKLGVRSVVVVYDFFGKVTKAEKMGTNVRYTLDNSDFQTPDFVTGDYTNFFKLSGDINSPPTAASVNDVKLGDYVNFSMVYYPKTKIWELRGVSIQTVPIASPSASSQ